MRLPLYCCCAVLHLFNTPQVTKAVMEADGSRLVTGASGWTDFPVLHCAVLSSVLYLLVRWATWRTDTFTRAPVMVAQGTPL